MPIDDKSAAETAEQIRLQAGRRAPFTQVGDWVLLAPIRLQAKILYWGLSAHINTGRGDTEVWPTQDMLAEILGFSEGRKIRPFLKELVAIDAVSITTKRYAGEMRKRSIYTVHQTHPDNYAGHKSLKDFYDARRAQIKAAQESEAA